MFGNHALLRVWGLNQSGKGAVITLWRRWDQERKKKETHGGGWVEEVLNRFVSTTGNSKL